MRLDAAIYCLRHSSSAEWYWCGVNDQDGVAGKARDWFITELSQRHVASACRSHEGTECARDILSPRRFPWIQTDLNSCDTRLQHVTVSYCIKTYMSHEANCRGKGPLDLRADACTLARPLNQSNYKIKVCICCLIKLVIWCWSFICLIDETYISKAKLSGCFYGKIFVVSTNFPLTNFCL